MPKGNHRAIWLGGGGIGKTRTLKLVVEPLATTFFGGDGYLATAQSNHAAHNLGTRGRTIHSANGIMAMDSLQTAKLRLNPASQKKMELRCKLRRPFGGNRTILLSPRPSISSYGFDHVLDRW